MSNHYTETKTMEKLLTEFQIDTADKLRVTDGEVSDLLMGVYVDAGFTSPDDAATQFEPQSVRNRGVMFGARDPERATLAGMIIVVPPESPARRLAKNNEAEIHLLGVRPEYRGHGLGRTLVDTAVAYAVQNAYSKIILWTQLFMYSAQTIYESVGFVHIDNIVRNGREFKVYEKAL